MRCVGLSMSSVDYCEKLALRRLAAEQQKSVLSNSFRPLPLRKRNNNVPGMILLQNNDGLLPGANIVSRWNSLGICTLEENRHRETADAKSSRMILLHKGSKQLFWNDSFVKRGGGWGGVGALAMPNSTRGSPTH